jgi:hypothetical protein
MRSVCSLLLLADLDLCLGGTLDSLGSALELLASLASGLRFHEDASLK